MLAEEVYTTRRSGPGGAVTQFSAHGGFIRVRKSPAKKGGHHANLVTVHFKRVEILCFDTDSQVFMLLGLASDHCIPPSEYSFFVHIAITQVAYLLTAGVPSRTARTPQLASPAGNCGAHHQKLPRYKGEL
jgi:hypothetical protein